MPKLRDYYDAVLVAAGFTAAWGAALSTNVNVKVDRYG